MSEPTPMSVPPELELVADSFPGLIPGLRDARVAGEDGPLSERDIELIRLGVMIAIDAPQASFDAHVKRARSAGASDEEIVAVPASVATILGVPRLLASLPRTKTALEQ